jgi:ATP-binding cassette subfamily B protein
MSFPFYRQQGTTDCGPTCLKIITTFYGKDCDIGRIREDTGFDEEGVSLFGLYTAALNLGFRAESVSLTFEELIDDPRTPAILHWGKNHFVVFVGTAIGATDRQEVIVVADPAREIIRFTKDEFCRLWLKKTDNEGRLVGFALLLEPAGDSKSP